MASTRYQRWSTGAVIRMLWAVLSCFVVESIVFGISVLPAVLFWEWHLHWNLPVPFWIRVTLLSMAFIPAYLLFVFSLMILSAMTTRIFGWRAPDNSEMPINHPDWPLLNWGRYSVSTHLVRIFAGPLFRATPVWTMYMRLNGARLGHRVFVNSLGVIDHNLLEFGNDVVIGSDVHLSGHTVERGMVKTAKVRLGDRVTVGASSIVEIGVEAGPGCQIGALSFVPKFLKLEAEQTYAGIPVRRIEPHEKKETKMKETLTYQEQGKGHILIMVPGLDGTALMFYRQIPLLARHFHVVTFPLPNDSACTMESLVENLRGVIQSEIEKHGKQSVLLCGESFGGALSLSFSLSYPELLDGLIILNSFPKIRKRFQLGIAPFLLKAMPWGAMPTVRRFTETRLHSPHTLPEDLAEFHERMRSVGKKGYLRRLEILKSYDIENRLQEIETPTLFLAGELDRLVPSVKEAQFMSSRMPHASTVVLKAYGHICLINHDFNLLDYVMPWLEKISPYSEPPSASKGRDAELPG